MSDDTTTAEPPSHYVTVGDVESSPVRVDRVTGWTGYSQQWLECTCGWRELTIRELTSTRLFQHVASAGTEEQT